MTARTRITRSVPLGVLLAYVALTAWSAACTREGRRGARSTPAAVFASIEGASRAQVNAYADGLAFDTVAPGMDSTSFMTPSGVSYVRAEPEIGATSVSRANLVRGRIIARIRTTGAASPLHTPAGYGATRRASVSTTGSAIRCTRGLRSSGFSSIWTHIRYGKCGAISCREQRRRL